MNFLTGSSKNSWHPVMTSDTTTWGYWFNWRVVLCGIWVLITTIFASYLIWRYEGFRNSNGQIGETEKEPAGLLNEDEVWRPCLKGIHPVWLLGFRVFAFFVLLSLLVTIGIVDGGSIFYFYTQWTFTLITIYFGLGSLLSIYGCFRYHNIVGGERVVHNEVDSEQGGYPEGMENNNLAITVKSIGSRDGRDAVHPAGFWAYAFQIIFQMNAGAVMLTDCVFWFIIFPFLTIRDYNLNFLMINMHSINAFFLLGDTALNSLRFPWFRSAYFFLWTVLFVIFQWIVHACVLLGWPYPFLDLSSPYAPLWYLMLGLLHIPCYGIFTLIIKLKHFMLSRWFPQSYRYAG